MDLLPALEAGQDAAFRIGSDRNDFLAQPERRAALAHEVHQCVDHLAVHEVEHGRPGLDHGDLDVQRRNHRRVLETDDAGSDDDDLSRKRRALKQLVGIDDPVAVEGNVVAVRRTRAAGDENMLGRQACEVAVAGRHLEGVRIDEPGRAVHGRDVVAPELRAHDLHLSGHDLLHAEGEIRDRDLAVDGVVLPVERLLAKAREVENRLAQRFGRNRPGVQADAADHLLAVHNRDSLPELGRGDRALLPGRSGSDHDEVVGRGHGSQRLMTRVKFPLSLRASRPSPPWRRRTAPPSSASPSASPRSAGNVQPAGSRTRADRRGWRR